MTSDLRIGLGIDLHRLEPGRPCVLAGVRIDSNVGPVAHSDGDAVLHAAVDAVLGAAGLDDLGTLFREDSPDNENRDSSEFCIRAMELLRDRGLEVSSMDVVVETEQPKLRPHRQAMRARLAELFGIEPDCVNLKGKSGEGVDAVGRGEAIRATAVALVRRA